MKDPLERFSLSGRVVLVTGATRGLGLEIARGMAAAGAMVGITGRDAARVTDIVGGVPGAFAAAFDITDTRATAAATRSSRRTAGSTASSTTPPSVTAGRCRRSRPTISGGCSRRTSSRSTTSRARPPSG